MNADLNLTLVTATINGLIFQITDSLMETMGVGGGGYACPGVTVSQNARYRFDRCHLMIELTTIFNTFAL